jgi:hypothetical protein
MKRFLLACTVLATLSLTAQPVLEVTLDSPQQGATIVSGGTFQWDITVSNTGNATHNSPANGDSCIYYPTVNGSLISVNGQTQAFLIADPIPAGQSVMRSRAYIFSGGTSGNWNVCGRILYFGSSYTGELEDSSCVDVTYNSMSMDEFVVASYVDDSYYSNGMYHVRLLSAENMNQPKIEIIDISGRTVVEANLVGDNRSIEQDVDVSGLPQGVYIVRLRTADEVINVRKVLKN